MGKGGESATEDDEDWDDDDLWSYIEYYLTIIQLINLHKAVRWWDNCLTEG